MKGGNKESRYHWEIYVPGTGEHRDREHRTVEYKYQRTKDRCEMDETIKCETTGV